MNGWFDILKDLAVFWGGFTLALLCLLLVLGLPYAIYYVVSLPLRRQERARFFLDLLESSLKSGQSVEHGLVAMAHSRDRSLGVRFHLLAAHLESGLRLEQAVEKVPRLLPPQIAAMLKVGQQIGDLAKVLPACRQLLRDGVSQTRGALNYLLVLAFVITPIVPFLFASLSVFVVPKIHAIGQEFIGTLPPITEWIFGWSQTFIVIQIAIVILFLFLTLAFVGGPRLRAWGHPWHYPFTDRLSLWLPWRRKRLQRDFSTLLALLLDAEVPESEAVKRAADCTANWIFIRQAEEVAHRLVEGLQLTEAVRQIDDTGEFHWRLTNASHGHKGFLAALSGWLEALDAKAFQQEQAAAQLLTTGLVLVNGVMVGVFAVGLFAIFIAIIEAGVTLW